MKGRFSIIQKASWVYAFLFIFVVILGYLPGVEDSQGLMFGLFKIDLIDDLLHLFSGIWAASAAWHSTKSSVIYFKIFGSLYFIDGVIGVLTGKGLLDFTVFMSTTGIIDIGTKIAANIPHVAIGGIAIYIGFFLSRKIKP